MQINEELWAVIKDLRNQGLFDPVTLLEGFGWTNGDLEQELGIGSDQQVSDLQELFLTSIEPLIQQQSRNVELKGESVGCRYHQLSPEKVTLILGAVAREHPKYSPALWELNGALISGGDPINAIMVEEVLGEEIDLPADPSWWLLVDWISSQVPSMDDMFIERVVAQVKQATELFAASYNNFNEQKRLPIDSLLAAILDS